MGVAKQFRLTAVSAVSMAMMIVLSAAGSLPAQAAEDRDAKASDAKASDTLKVADQAANVPKVSVRSRRRPSEEITVTARKTEENLKDVPLSITAFDSNMIETAGITNLQDVADLTPGLTFFNAQGEFLPTPVIRGVAPTDIFGESNAAIFVDGVYVSGRSGLNFSQLDVERIEVVKGPQSALYGRTAFAGALNYITKRPAHELEARVDVEVGNENKQKIFALVSGPLFTDALRGRVAGLYDDWDGSYNNSDNPQTPISGRRFRSLQGSLVWDATDNLEFYGSVYSSNDTIDEGADIGILRNCEDKIEDLGEEDQFLLNDVRFKDWCGPIPTLENAPSPAPGLFTQNSLPTVAKASGQNRELFRANLNIAWDFNFGTFSSLTGFSRTKGNSNIDFGQLGDSNSFLYCEGASVEAPGVPNSCGQNPADKRFFAGILSASPGVGETSEISQEIRFTSSQDQAIRYTVGSYFFSSNSFARGGGGIIAQAPKPGDDIGFPPFSASAPNFAIGTAIFYCTFTDDGCGDPLGREGGDTDTEGWAVFGGLDWDFTDRLTGRVELRYGEQEETIERLVYTRCDTTGDPTGECGDDWWDLRFPEAIPEDPNDSTNPDNSRSGSADFSAVTGRLGLDYKVNDGWMIYGSVATGRKPGGLTLSTLRVVNPDGSDERERFNSTFDSETLTAYELGLKGSTENGRLGFDMAVFYNDWQDIVLTQLIEFSPTTGKPLLQPQSFSFNAGTADVLGWEMTADAGFTDDLSGRVAVAWTDATLKDAVQERFVTHPTFAPDGDVSGNKLLRQAEWTASASLNYVRSLWGGWEGFGRLDWSYTDKVYIGNDNLGWLPSRNVVNTRFGLESGRYSLAFWIRNLLNDDEPTAAFKDIFWSNSNDQVPPYDDLGPRPSFDNFVPLRLTVTYPSLRTYGVTVAVRFGGLVD